MDKIFIEADFPYRSEDEFLIALGEQIGKNNLEEVLSQHHKEDIYKFSKQIIENIIYDCPVKECSFKAVIDYAKINKIINKHSPLLKFPQQETILDYSYLVLKKEELQKIIGGRSTQEIIIEALDVINKLIETSK